MQPHVHAIYQQIKASPLYPTERSGTRPPKELDVMLEAVLEILGDREGVPGTADALLFELQYLVRLERLLNEPCASEIAKAKLNTYLQWVEADSITVSEDETHEACIDLLAPSIRDTLGADSQWNVKILSRTLLSLALAGERDRPGDQPIYIHFNPDLPGKLVNAARELSSLYIQALRTTGRDMVPTLMLDNGYPRLDYASLRAMSRNSELPSAFRLGLMRYLDSFPGIVSSSLNTPSSEALNFHQRVVDILYQAIDQLAKRSINELSGNE